MRFEWKKISGYVLVLLILAVAANAWLFYRHCTDDAQGYTFDQLRQKFDCSTEALEAENAELEQRAFFGDPNENDADDSLVTGSVKNELRLNHAILDRHSVEYSAYLNSVQTEADFRIQSGMFGDESSFSVRSMQKTKEIYGRLYGLPVVPTFSGVTEAFRSWRLSDLLFLFFVCAPSLFLLTQERRSGLLALLRPTKHGHGALYLRKFAAMTGIVLLGFLLIYGADLAITVSLFGVGELSAPIQSFYGFHTCPTPLTLAGYLIQFFGAKLLWGWCIGTVFFALCACLTQIPALFGAAFGVVALALGMGASKSLWLRAMSLLRLSDTESLFTQCIFLDFFGTPVRQVPVSIGFLVLLVSVCFAIGWVAFVRQPVSAAAKSIGTLRLHGLKRHTNLFLHEGQKLWITHGALLATVVLIVIQIGSYRSFDAPSDTRSYYYKIYAEALSGAPCEASDRYLAEEQAHYNNIHEEIASIYAAAGEDTFAAQLAAEPLQAKLRGEEGFQEAKRQYESLREGQYFVYRTGYERLCGRLGQQEDLGNAVKLLLYLILVFSGVFAVEHETGMEILLQSAGAKRRVAVRKLIHCIIILLIGFCVCFVPQYLAVRANYGLPNLGAQANSLDIFGSFSDGWTIRAVLLTTGLARLLLSAAAGAIILFLSKKTGSRITTILLSIGLLLLPALALLLFVV